MDSFPQSPRSRTLPASFILAALLCWASPPVCAKAPQITGADSWAKHDKHLVVPLKNWTIYLSPDLLEKSPDTTKTMLAILDQQLKRVEDVVPAAALRQLQTVPIWINPTYENQRPGAEYHPDAGWLKENGRNTAMARCIEIHNVEIFERENIRMPYLLLHELAHAYHDQVLGFDDQEISQAFRKAAASGSYNKVRRFNGETYSTGKAYAMSNHKEYFAENTEALFGKNDFFPFNLKELTKHDPTALAVLRKKWGVEN